MMRRIVISLLAVIVCAALLLKKSYQILHSPFNLQVDYIFLIPPKTPLRVMTHQLSKDGILQHPTLFLLWIYASGFQKQIKAGEYAIKPGMTPIILMDSLCAGRVVQHALTIVPGWTFSDLRRAVDQHKKLDHQSNHLSDQALMAALGHPINPEARFYADTYHFPLGTPDVAFLKRAYDRMDRQLNVLWESRSNHYPLASKDEVLILASIIEKESAFDHEYRDIAGVYMRRLIKKMPLQADPTVLYGLGPNWIGPLTKAGLAMQTPYNTYKNPGLPPTPIAIPSQKALEAAMDPAPGDALYFVLRPDRQGHVFSKNLQDHVRAVQQYRQRRE